MAYVKFVTTIVLYYRNVISKKEQNIFDGRK